MLLLLAMLLVGPAVTTEAASRLPSHWWSEAATAGGGSGGGRRLQQEPQQPQLVEPAAEPTPGPAWPLFDPPMFERINPHGSFAPCDYGSLPGMWLPDLTDLIRGWNTEPPAFGPFSVPVTYTASYGHGWQVFEPKCQLHNWLGDYIHLRPREAPEAQRPMRIHVMGDRCAAHAVLACPLLHVGRGSAGHDGITQRQAAGGRTPHCPPQALDAAAVCPTLRFVPYGLQLLAAILHAAIVVAKTTTASIHTSSLVHTHTYTFLLTFLFCPAACARTLPFSPQPRPTPCVLVLRCT